MIQVEPAYGVWSWLILAALLIIAIALFVDASSNSRSISRMLADIEAEIKRRERPEK